MNSMLGIRSVLLGAASLVMMVVATGAQAQVPCRYEVTAVIQAPECPPYGFPSTIGTGLSEAGDVVGYYQSCVIGPHAAFLWTGADGQFITLDMPPGTASSEAHDIVRQPIVGFFDVPGDGLSYIAFLLDGDEFTEIPPPSGGTFSQAWGLNVQQQVAGTSADPATGFKKAFFWEKGIMTLIQPTFGPRSAGRDINDAKTQIVGWMGTASGIDSHAFLFQDGVVTDLGLPPNTFASRANSVNNVGQVLVRGEFNNDEATGRIIGSFIWQGGTFTDLGALPGYEAILPTDLNDHSQAVGICAAIKSSALPTVGFIWQDGVMTDLNDLIESDVNLAVVQGRAINSAGQILANATVDGDAVAVVLTPIAPPIGDLDGDCRVGILDLLTLLAAWGPCDGCPADLDGDGVVGILDLLTLLANWG